MGWHQSYTHSTPCTAANLLHTISSALDLWAISRAVFILRAMCHCWKCLSAVREDRHFDTSRRNTPLKTPLENLALVPGMSLSLCARLCVRHCLHTPLLSLARQWPFTTNCQSGQYVRKTFGTTEGEMAGASGREMTAGARTAREQKAQCVRKTSRREGG